MDRPCKRSAEEPTALDSNKRLRVAGDDALQYAGRTRTRRGRGSSKKRKNAERYDKAKVNATLAGVTTVRHMETHPGTFDHSSTNPKITLEDLHTSLPWMRSENWQDLLQSAPEDGIFVVKPSDEVKNSLPHGHPGVYLVRCDKLWDSTVNQLVVDAWDDMLRAGVKFPDDSKDSNRSTTPALHLNVWGLYRDIPSLSGDTVNQTPEARKAIANFLNLIRQHLSKKVGELLRHYAPETYERQLGAQAYLRKKLGRNPNWIDMGPAFFTVAVKEGCSELIHLDYSDHPQSLSWMVPFGNFTGGEFCAPQLDLKVPVRPGQALACTTRVLFHCGAATEGRRIVLTLFSDKWIIQRGDKLLSQGT